MENFDHFNYYSFMVGVGEFKILFQISKNYIGTLPNDFAVIVFTYHKHSFHKPTFGWYTAGLLTACEVSKFW